MSRTPAVGFSSFRRKARRAFEFHDLIYLVCPAGFPNYGDELIAEAWLRYFARHRPLATVVVDCSRVGNANLVLRQANPRAVFVDTLWELTRYAHSAPDNPEVDPERPWEWVAKAASTYGPAPLSSLGVEMLLRAKTIHLVGGGYVNDLWSEHIGLVAAVAEVSRVTGARAVATGQGLMPPLEGEARERLVADAARFEVFDVRDRPSLDLLGDAPGAVQNGDDAWLSPRIQAPEHSVKQTGEVILCAQSDLTEDFRRGGLRGAEALADLLTATLDEWEVPGNRVTVVEAIPGLDLAIPDLMGSRLEGARRLTFHDIWRDGLPSGRGGTWLSTRFHPHLLAAAVGDSGVAIVPKPDYYDTKHVSLTAAGSHWTLLTDGEQVPEWPTDGGFAHLAAGAAMERKQNLAKDLYPGGVHVH
ncbi:MAG: polysaccharide pyruvyl transferase family protein [Gordonia sp. (in: high G+C Gram-positive bacteria)]|uniref:polysaccharide pyruvyl transferase family protein n=1 Tax=Gordonia sp. (in: high G+C Gram-positive bacteria) TaxID=84139 RepID=UPI0039E49CD1